MAALDRLGWADGIAIRAFGVRVGIRTSTRALLTAALARVPGGYRVSRSAKVDVLFSLVEGGTDASTRVRRFHILWANHTFMARTEDRGELIDAFESALGREFVRRARGYQFVHAGCVGWRGRAIVVPGYSHAGKSTLVRALVDVGATYYSDEFAVFDRRGRVHPFPRTLRLRGEPRVDAEIHAQPAERTTIPPPLPLGLVVKTTFESGAEWNPQPLAAGDTLLALLPHAGRANSAPATVMATFARSTARAAGIESARGDADTAASGILAEFNAED